MNEKALASSEAVPGWCLLFLSGAMKGRTVALHVGANLVGCAGDCSVMLPGGEAQPHHLMFSVGELVVALQRLGDSSARLNGDEITQQRRSVVAGDVITIGKIEFQLDRSYPATELDDMFSGPESIFPDDALAPAARSSAPRSTRRWAAAALIATLGAGLMGMVVWNGMAAAPAHDTLNLAAVQKALIGYPEVEVVALGGGQHAVRGYVESRARRQALEQALAPLGSRVSVNVQAADEIIEQARRYIADPSVAIKYTGQGRLVVSGAAGDASLRERIRRLAEDLHPTVLVTDRVHYPPGTEAKLDADGRTQWAALQALLPARVVSITDDGNGNRYLQLANGSRYYEGAMLRSGAELKRIEADSVVVSGADTLKEK